MDPFQMNCDRSDCKAHKYYRGGKRDGEVTHLTSVHPTDFPMTMGTILRNGQRSWYEKNFVDSSEYEVFYDFIGLGRNIEDCRK